MTGRDAEPEPEPEPQGEPEREPEREPQGNAAAGRRRWSRAPLVGAAVGVPVMAYGAWGAWHDPRAGAAEAARWLVGVTVVHDALWLPALAVVTTLATRRLPALARAPVAAALAASAVVVAVAWPYAARYGANPMVPSLLVRDVATGTAAYVAAIWAVALAVAARRLRRARRTPR